MIGFNLYDRAIAAVGISQMNNLEHHVSERVSFARKLSNNLGALAGIEVPAVRPDCTHSYYNWVHKV